MGNLSTATLVTDALSMVRHEPARLLFQRGCAVWGLTPIISKETLWIALSISGMAILAARLRPWIHTTAPDLDAFARDLRPHLRHAEKSAEKGFLFTIPAMPFGRCGQHVMLCQATTQNFPWIEPATIHPATGAPSALPEALWKEMVNADPADIQRLQSGGMLPADAEPMDFLKRHAFAAGATDLHSESGHVRMRAILTQAIERERARLQILDACLGSSGDIGIPGWLAQPTHVLDEFMIAATQQQTAHKSNPTPTSDVMEAIDAEAPPARSRRPTHHPSLVPSRLPPASTASAIVEANGPSEISGLGPYQQEQV